VSWNKDSSVSDNLAVLTSFGTWNSDSWNATFYSAILLWAMSAQTPIVRQVSWVRVPPQMVVLIVAIIAASRIFAVFDRYCQIGKKLVFITKNAFISFPTVGWIMLPCA
jgi:hypothetical protein